MMPQPAPQRIPLAAPKMHPAALSAVEVVPLPEDRLAVSSITFSRQDLLGEIARCLDASTLFSSIDGLIRAEDRGLSKAGILRHADAILPDAAQYTVALAAGRHPHIDFLFAEGWKISVPLCDAWYSTRPPLCSDPYIPLSAYQENGSAEPADLAEMCRRLSDDSISQQLVTFKAPNKQQELWIPDLVYGNLFQALKDEPAIRSILLAGLALREDGRGLLEQELLSRWGRLQPQVASLSRPALAAVWCEFVRLKTVETSLLSLLTPRAADALSWIRSAVMGLRSKERILKDVGSLIQQGIQAPGSLEEELAGVLLAALVQAQRKLGRSPLKTRAGVGDSP